MRREELSIKKYAAGFLLSLATTIAAYLVVQHHLNTHHLSLSDNITLAIIMTLALVQLFVQLVFFLHLSLDRSKRWNAVILAFAALMIIILVGGSLWIMYNLNYHMDSPARQDQKIIKDEGVQP